MEMKLKERCKEMLNSLFRVSNTDVKRKIL